MIPIKGQSINNFFLNLLERNVHSIITTNMNNILKYKKIWFWLCVCLGNVWILKLNSNEIYVCIICSPPLVINPFGVLINHLGVWAVFGIFNRFRSGFWSEFGRFRMGFVRILERFGQILGRFGRQDWRGIGEAFHVEELALMIRATRGRSINEWNSMNKCSDVLKSLGI